MKMSKGGRRNPPPTPNTTERPQLAADAAEDGCEKLGKPFLEGREMPPGEARDDRLERRIAERRVDAEEIGGLRPLGKAGLAVGQRIRIGLRLADLERDRL